MSFLNVYIVVSPDNVHFGEQLPIFEHIKEIINAGQWGFILDGKSIDFLIILDEATTAILFCNEETGTGIRQFRFLNLSSLQFVCSKQMGVLMLLDIHCQLFFKWILGNCSG